MVQFSERFAARELVVVSSTLLKLGKIILTRILKHLDVCIRTQGDGFLPAFFTILQPHKIKN
jgi:hypothetical protein